VSKVLPMLALRSILALVVPVTVLMLIPHWIVERWGTGDAESGALRLVGVSLIAAGSLVLIWCVWNFARKGRGTLAPIDPPTRLVVRGLYRYVRNPMYLGALLILMGQTVLFASAALLWYLIAWFISVHLFVVFYEEPVLRRQFGDSYDRYCRSVRRWMPS
jgi:protein-S-isoprenylcysteine O-methyltransferase Ste14